jgi:hypothetical protein
MNFMCRRKSMFKFYSFINKSLLTLFASHKIRSISVVSTVTICENQWPLHCTGRLAGRLLQHISCAYAGVIRMQMSFFILIIKIYPASRAWLTLLLHCASLILVQPAVPLTRTVSAVNRFLCKRQISQTCSSRACSIC